MNQALWISKTGLSAQDTRLATVSNNLANAATVGFKRDDVVFEDLLYQIRRQPGASSSESTTLPSGLQVGTGVRVIGTQKEFTEGSVQITEKPLDLAIVGRGFFEILMPDGTSGYTRNGQFQINQNGEIVNSRGLILQPAITVPQTTTSLEVAVDGTISAQEAGQAAPTNLGQVQLAGFVNPSGLQPVGENLYLETGSSGAAVIGTAGLDGLGQLRGGQLETSNVSTVEELVAMIETQRTYETNAKVLSAVDQMLQFINQTL